MTDTDEPDKKKIKIEEAPEELSTQNQQTEQSSPQNNQIQQHPNRSEELLTTAISTNNSTLPIDTVASTALPTTVITTQRHRMITTAGRIQ